MFSSPWIRKPDFQNVKEIDYNDYWQFRGWKLNSGLKPREKIMLDIIPTKSKIADIGCGNSLLPLKLKEKNCMVSVADISKTVLDQYRELGINSFEINLEKIDSIKLPDQFDYLILSEVLEHTRNPEQIIKALKPCTKYFLITVPNSASYQFRYGLMFGGRFFTQWIYHPSEHLRYWSHIDFLDWLSALGLEVVFAPVSDGFTFRGLLPWLPNLWKNLLGFRMVYHCKVLQS
ncbi:MAG: class I SAM-dependent methyltransferase [Patescibacteria group bacterium]